MATVTSLTETKIQELMSGWTGVALSQDAINALVSQLWTDVASQGANLENFNEVILPDLLADLAAGAIAVNDIVTNGLPDLESALAANELAITNINTAVLPLLQTEITSANNWIFDLNETVLPGLDAALLDLVDKFPVEGPDIAVDTITANNIAAHTITALEILADTITANEIAADTITANEIAADTITANEIAADTITANEIAVGTITAAEIAVGTITAQEIMTGSITSLQLNVEDIAAAVIQTGLLQAQLTITGVLQIAGANMGWSDALGLWLGNGTVFYGDDRINEISGQVTTSSLSVQDGLSISGDANLHGTMIAKNGITTPTGKMSLGQTWPRITSALGDGTGDSSNIWQGLYDYSSTQWLIAYNFFGAGLRVIEKATGNWAGDLVCGTWKNNFYPAGGLAVTASNYYLLGSDSTRSGNYYIYQLDKAGNINKVNERLIGNLVVFGGKRPRLVTDGTNVGMIWGQTSTDDLKLRWFTPDLSAQVGTDITLVTDFGVVNIGDAYYGPAQVGGTSRLWISAQQGDSNMVRCFTTGGVRVASEDFPRAGGSTILGLSYDSTAANQRMVSYDVSGLFWTYSKYYNGGNLNAQHTDNDRDNANYPSGTIINGVDVSGTASGFHETSPSPVSTYALAKRAWPTISAPPAPDELITDATQVDKANVKGIYASVGSTPRLQAYLAVGVRELPLTDDLSTSGAVAGSSGVPSFANASVPSPGRLRASGVDLSGSPIWDLLGSGAGRAGHSRWDATGKPLNHGEYLTVTTPNAAASAWTVRSGWTQRNSTDSPAHGISFASGTFTVSQSGLWDLSAGVTIDGVTLANGRKVTAIAVNGTKVLRAEAPGTHAQHQVTVGVSGKVYLAAGDQITVEAWHNNASVLPFLGGDGQNYFTAYCIAAF